MSYELAFEIFLNLVRYYLYRISFIFTLSSFNVTHILSAVYTGIFIIISRTILGRLPVNKSLAYLLTCTIPVIKA